MHVFPFNSFLSHLFLSPTPISPRPPLLLLCSSDRSGFTQLQMKFYHTCTAVVIKHSCLLSRALSSWQLNKPAMKHTQYGCKRCDCPNTASRSPLWQICIYPLTQQEKTSSESSLGGWMVNDTAGSYSDSGFLSECWRGCEGRSAYVSNLVGLWLSANHWTWLTACGNCKGFTELQCGREKWSVSKNTVRICVCEYCISWNTFNDQQRPYSVNLPTLFCSSDSSSKR